MLCRSVSQSRYKNNPVPKENNPVPKENNPVPKENNPVPKENNPIIYPDITQTLLNITSDKTGYPVEMLETDMDIEADLGIDSIKRVEILGALQEQYPDLPQPNLEELAELRTIEQIVTYLQTLTTPEKKTPINPVLVSSLSK